MIADEPWTWRKLTPPAPKQEEPERDEKVKGIWLYDHDIQRWTFEALDGEGN